jgi:Holliday junction resolvase
MNNIPENQEIKKNTKLNFEGEIYFYFSKKGYHVVQGKYLSDEAGIPDLYITKGNDKFYVEVKNIGGSLALIQINWIVTHKEKVYIAVKNVSGDFSFFEIIMNEVQL